MNLEDVKQISLRFMEEHYPHEAPYFHIAWDIFEELDSTESDSIMNFKGPRVRLNGNGTVMAPRIIRAYYILFKTYGEDIYTLENTHTTRSAMSRILTEKEFTLHFSERIIEFFFIERPSTG